MDFELYQQARLKHDETSGNYYLFNVNNGKHYRLNQTSYEILVLLEKSNNKNEIAKQMSKNYNVDSKLLINDIELVLEFLLKEKLGRYNEKN